MITTFVFFPLIILFFLLVIAVPVMMGIFVYRDAKAHGMDPLLWTLVAIFAPGFIGLIIYLIMRRDHVRLTCPSCGSEVQQTFVSCPNCGQKLCASCSNCGTALSEEWKLCPQCGTEITETSDFTPPVAIKTNNKGFVMAILAILAVPLALMIIAVCFFAYSGSVNYNENDAEAGIDDFTYQMDLVPACVSSADACGLSDSELEWIKEKKAGKKGIYSVTVSKSEKGEKKTDTFTGTYDIVYDYTIVVVNSEQGKSYVCDGMSCDVAGQYIPDTVNISLTEESPDDEEAILYGNVFVVRAISGYTMHWSNIDGSHQESAEIRGTDGDRALSVTLGESVSYDIPCNQGKETYTPFKK